MLTICRSSSSKDSSPSANRCEISWQYFAMSKVKKSRGQTQTRPTSMKSKAQMSRFHNWVNHMMRPCAFVVKLQADFNNEPISGLASLYSGSGAALS